MVKELRERRSIRRYKDIKVEEDILKDILSIGRMAPSGKNKKPWEFLIVDEKKINEKLSQVKPKGGIFLKETPVSIVVVGREDISDTWIEDCSIASIYMQLEAHSRGLGSCWVQIKGRFTEEGSDAEERVKEILGIEKDKRVLCILSLGYPDQSLNPYKIEDFRG